MRPDIPILHGAGDDVYCTQVWLNRVAAMMSHIRILRAHIPDGSLSDWLKNQADAALAEGQSFIDDAKPSDLEEGGSDD